MKPRLKLVKGYAVVSQAPDELEAAIERFLMFRSALKSDTLKQYRRVLKLYRQLCPAWPPTEDALAAFIDHCQASYGDYTTHTYFGVVRGFIRFLLKRKMITDSPLAEISTPRRPALLPRAPLADGIKKLMAHLESEVENVLSGKASRRKGWREVRNLAMFSLMLDSGLRVSEAVNVRLEDVDLAAWSVFVCKGKGSKQREVPLGRTSRADLRLWLIYRETLPIPADNHFIFITKRKGWKPLDAGHVEQALEIFCKRLGIVPKITPHQLRHAFATYSHEAGATMERIRQWLGHSSMATTARYVLSREGLKDHLKSSPRDHKF